MYKYSKRVEERFFSNPCNAYFFLQFAQSEKGKHYIANRLPSDDSCEMNDRLVTEIELMTKEAKGYLVKHFSNKYDRLSKMLLQNLGINSVDLEDPATYNPNIVFKFEQMDKISPSVQIKKSCTDMKVSQFSLAEDS